MSPGLKGSGSSRWMSPELLDDGPRTPKADIYALGMTIVEILTGREPFADVRNPYKVYSMVSEDHRLPFEPLSRNGRDLRPIWELAASCWQKEPENRPTAAKVIRHAAHLLHTSLPRPMPIEFHSYALSDGGLDQDSTSDSPPQHTSGVYSSLVARISQDASTENPEVNFTLYPSDRTTGPFDNTPANSLARLALSSHDSHLIQITGQVALSHSSDMYHGLYTPTRLRLAMKCPRIFERGTRQAERTMRDYMREAKTWSSLNHVNILPFYGVVEISSITYLVAPWAAHGDLSWFLKDRLEYLLHSSPTRCFVSDRKRKAFSAFDEAATIHGIASALAYLHTCDLIHGDVKGGTSFWMIPSLRYSVVLGLQRAKNSMLRGRG
ncbi:Mitogen-activated protein kinase kinase kinase 7 [Tulasnella sp. JGI-2019a]|nr:Mitogen-activated protein kinase kinase kinase 7 [Tulasnella sp. JGI-2019a]